MLDVAILGGGPAGSATALSLLARRPSKVLVVEAGHHDRDREGESLPPDTTLVLQELGVLDRFREQGFERCPGSCSSWGREDLAHNDFLLSPFGAGWHLDRRKFDAFLAREAESAGAEVRRGTKVIRAEQCGSEGFLLRLARDDGWESEIRARAVVDATGPSAALARQFGARRAPLDRLVGVVAFWNRGDGRMTAQSLLEGVEIGWWYAARLPGKRVVTMLVTDPVNMTRLGLVRDEAWQSALRETRHIASALAGCGATLESSFVRPITPAALDRVCGEGWLAAGDAAGSLDPILAAGIHKALSDGLDAGEALAAALESDGDTDAQAAFERYRIRVRARFGSLMGNREHLYGLERRWPNAPFWARRFSRKPLDFSEEAR